MSIYKILIILFLLSYDIMTKKKEKNMTLAQLRYVITVSQVGTLSEAAKRLYISQPSLTNAIKELSNGNYNVRVDNVGQDEISKLNQGFNQMARQLAKQDETRQKFISDISHEFQTPLTSIQGFANILKEEDLPKEQRVKYANIILYNSKRLSSLAKNMLQLTLLDREEIELELTNYSLVEQMNRVISTQENQAMEKNIEIVFEMPKKEIFIEGDEQRLEQVWTNIISNAIKYTNEGGLITITMKKILKI